VVGEKLKLYGCPTLATVGTWELKGKAIRGIAVTVQQGKKSKKSHLATVKRNIFAKSISSKSGRAGA
jgi:hypothetical protein